MGTTFSKITTSLTSPETTANKVLTPATPPNNEGTDGNDGTTAGETDAKRDEIKLPSKKSIKKQRRLDKLKEKRNERKAKLREESAERLKQKRKEREDYLKTLTEEEKEEELKRRNERLKEFSSNRRKEREELNEFLVKKEGETRYDICVDIDEEWLKGMYEKEKKSLCRQIMYCYNSLKKCKSLNYKPIDLHICGVNDELVPFLNTYANGWKEWPVHISNNPLISEFSNSSKELVYLTHDADAVLNELSYDHIYIIGGVVDRNRLKNCTFDKANQHKIKTMKLNLDLNVHLEHGTKVLTVNHCVDILLHKANGLSWQQAYVKVLPDRKGIQDFKTKI